MVEQEELRTQLRVEDGVLYVDASDLQIFFPFDPLPRTFGSEEELLAFMRDELGGEGVLDDEGHLVGMRGRQLQVGNSFFFDPDLEIFYIVTDPILAYLGGVRGTVWIGTEERCLDADRDCTGRWHLTSCPVGRSRGPALLPTAATTASA